GQIPRVLLEGLVLSLGLWVCDAVTSADLPDGVEQCVAREAHPRQPLSELCVREKSEQNMLRRSVFVLELFGFRPRMREDLAKAARKRGLGRPPAYLRKVVQTLLEGLGNLFGLKLRFL